MNNEKPVFEEAFRRHAEECRCEAFEMRQIDAAAPLTVLEAFLEGRADYEIEGRYTWSGRNFNFYAKEHKAMFVGNVFVRAIPKAVVRMDHVQSVCAVVDALIGVGIELECLDKVDPSKCILRAAHLCAPSIGFTSVTVNWMSGRLDAALRRVEDASGTEPRFRR